MTRVNELCADFARLKQSYETIEEQLKAVNAEWTSVEEQLIEAMAEEGMNSIDLETLGKFSLKTTNYLSVNTANKEHFFEYLKESGNGGLLKLDVNPKTLTAFLGRHLEEIKDTLISTEELDSISAQEKALTFLKEKGANYFTKRAIALKGAKSE
jgi:hypothetical protein